MTFYHKIENILIYKHVKDFSQIQLKIRWKNWESWWVGYWKQ